MVIVNGVIELREGRIAPHKLMRQRAVSSEQAQGLIIIIVITSCGRRAEHPRRRSAGVVHSTDYKGIHFVVCHCAAKVALEAVVAVETYDRIVVQGISTRQ